MSKDLDKPNQKGSISDEKSLIYLKEKQPKIYARLVNGNCPKEVERIITEYYMAWNEYMGTIKDSVKQKDRFVKKALQEAVEKAVVQIREDLNERYKQLQSLGKNIEAERLKTRTEYDIEMMQEVGYCSGIENYVRYLNSREAGEQPATLLDYFPDDFLIFIDECEHENIASGGKLLQNPS